MSIPLEFPDPPSRRMTLRGQLEAMPPGALVPVAWLLEHLEAEEAPPPARTHAEPDRLLTVAETAERVGMSRRWCYQHADELPAVRLPGGALRFSARRLEAWMQRRAA